MIKYIISLLTLITSLNCFGQIDKWKEYEKSLTNIEFEKLIQPKKYNLDSNNFLYEINKWRDNESITGKIIFEKIINWNKYPKPKKTGVICKYMVKLDSTAMDVNYTPPFYVYIPKNYSHNKPTKLLIHYKGGWLSRKEFPKDVDKEIVNDNPTFSYLDKYNIIQIFPALKSDLAIYGWYGYEHLRKMILQTKKLFNIDDNQVYLSGFSDGGRTVYSSSYLIPTVFAGFYPINGTINTSRVNFPNFTSRDILAHIAGKDAVVYFQYPISIAEKANEWNINWTIKLLPEKEHFYHTYEKEILPIIFNHIENTTRKPFPNRIINHRNYDYPEFKNIDWIQYKVNTERKPEKWHHTSQAIISIKETETDTFEYGIKTGQINAKYFNNTFEIKTSLVDEVEIYISPLMVNIELPVKIIINGKIIFNKKISYSKDFLIEQFENNFDRKQVWINKISLKVE
tara:strand:+ start:10 stop:1374 length:1365 start_codon:yes stop_codon:yes gene_type:complete